MLILILYFRNSIGNTIWQSQECTAVVKIETTTTTIREIKTEPLEDYEQNIENPQFSNLNTSIHNSFNCDMCYEVFDDFEMLFIHKSLYHQNKPYVCEFCDQRFSLSLHLNIHIAEHVNNFCTNRRAPTDIQSSSKSQLALNYNNRKSISFSNSPKTVQNKKNVRQKKLCDKVSMMSTQKYNASNSNSFLQNTRECKPFKCPNCLFSSSSENKFINHHNVCNVNFDNSYIPENKQFDCHLCSKTFINKSSLNGHMRYHSLRGEIISKKSLKINKFQNILESQNNTCGKNSVKVNKCKECNKNFISRRKLNIHYKQHKKQMMCKICHKQFFLEKAFEKHLLIHENITEEKDNSINTSFNEDHSFNSRKSTKSKSLKIKFFAKKITEDKKLQKIPLKEIKTFQCLYCGKYYKTTKSLGEHKRRYHANVKPKLQRLASIKCNWCSAVITKCNLIRHINSFHPKVKPLKCTHCTLKFKNHSSMKLHINNSHKK